LVTKHFAVWDKHIAFALINNELYTSGVPMQFKKKIYDKICPIEVKSSGYKSHKSLDEFNRKYSSRIKDRYLLYTKDLRKEGNITCLPVYMTGLL